MKLCVISHTEHYKTDDGVIVGWGPTINELNHLLDKFDEIYHVAMLHEGKAPESSLPYASSKIKFVPLPALGGTTIASKLKIVSNFPKVLSIVKATLKKVDVFQLRTPTGIAVVLIPYFTIFSKKKGWYKYAGNWNQKNPPLGYALQRWMLKQQSRKVTINGYWENQPENSFSFENPCLTLNEIEEGLKVINHKNLNEGITFCFVGRLERPKGVERIINAFSLLDREKKDLVKTIHMVGDGPERHYFEDIAAKSGVDFVFHGFRSRSEVFEIYKTSQVFLLPSSASEGFPKVIAEAYNFGCIPVVSSISSITHYISDNNGCIVDPLNEENLRGLMIPFLEMSKEKYLQYFETREEFVDKFSYDYYNNRIMNDILCVAQND
ncbi:glycosyltransferase [Winogradskyella sp. 3972H.M.0a.05]|uniref:glycosyltransferase n=1 Tax=Winogradskyella sp. 3972H.M.0a.05 TaxID=2950277 RepID=UPI003391060F